MEEKKLTDEEIVKAFKKGSQNHGYFTKINDKWVKYEDVFDLIDRQKAEIERLKNAYREGLEQGKFDSQVKITELQKKVKDLNKTLDLWQDDIHYLRCDKAELQKQVDELTEERKSKDDYQLGYSDGYYQATMECNNETFRALKDNVRKQIEKDKAKEILQDLDLFFKGTTFTQGNEFKKIYEKLNRIATEQGVEVDWV